MIAFAMFLMVISFPMAFFNFFPEWEPENATLGTAYRVLSSVPVALGTFITGFLLLFIFG